VLYNLLQERESDQNISHRAMPTFAQHKRFIRSYPYRFWYLIRVIPHYVGAIYLTRQNEIGVFIFRHHYHKGYGQEAVRQLMAKHPRKRFLANINPRNAMSIQFFERLGFNHLQNTYEYRP